MYIPPNSQPGSGSNRCTRERTTTPVTSSWSAMKPTLRRLACSLCDQLSHLLSGLCAHDFHCICSHAGYLVLSQATCDQATGSRVKHGGCIGLAEAAAQLPAVE